MGIPSKLYENKKETIERVLVDRINPHTRPLDVLITDLHKLHLRKTFEMVDTR